MTRTHHQFVVSRLVIDGWDRLKFKDKLMSAMGLRLGDYQETADLKRAIMDWHRVPDVFDIDRNTKTVTCVEIEDDSLMSMSKLLDYASLWDYLDAFDWILRLVVVDRYGTNDREIDLHCYFFEMCDKG